MARLDQKTEQGESPSERLEELIRRRFPPEGREERIARALAALENIPKTTLTLEEVRRIVEDPDLDPLNF